MLMVFMPDSDVQYQLALLLTVFFSVPSSLKLFDCFVHCIVNRKKGLTREEIQCNLPLLWLPGSGIFTFKI